MLSLAGREEVRQLLGQPERRWLLQRLLNRLRRGDVLPSRLSLKEPTPEQRESLNRLIGRRFKGATLCVKISDLRVALSTFSLPLEDLLEECFGPLRDVAKEIAEEEYQQGLDRLVEEEQREELKAWLADLRCTGLPKALVVDRIQAWELVRLAYKIARRLPAEGVSLAQLATEFTGDAHALDRGKPLSTILLRLASVINAGKSSDTALKRRMAWLSLGVLVDEVSSTVLTYRLPLRPKSFVGRVAELHRKNNEPCRLSLRQLVGDSLLIRPSEVYVCENPTVLSVAADQLAGRCRALVCTEGVPSSAVLYLLDRLVESGCSLFYHGDFDWGGVKIANYLIERYPETRMWRMGCSDYERLEKGRPLEGTPVPACWDEELAPVMAERGLAFHEEGSLSVLLSDLRLPRKKRKKKKKKRVRGPKRKRLNREQRLQRFQSAWPLQLPKDAKPSALVRHYSNWFGVDKVTAGAELHSLGFPIGKEQLQAWKSDAERRGMERAARKERKKAEEELVWGEEFLG